MILVNIKAYFQKKNSGWDLLRARGRKISFRDKL